MTDSIPPKPRQWADVPFPLIETPKYKERKTGYTDPYTETASTMCVVHNSLLRGLNSIYNQGSNIQPTDYKDFIGYSLCWHSVVHEHHTSEEDQFFPEIEEAVGEKGIMEENIQQHTSFQSGLDDFKAYLTNLSGKEPTFNASHLNNIITSFAPALHAHLTSEILSLLNLKKYGSTLPIADLWNKEGKQTVTTMPKLSALPFFFLNLDVTHEEYLWQDWPPIPGAARWAITRCFTLWNRGYWRFASCDSNGVPKPLCA